MPTLTLGYSPCPNDTYIFGALALGIVRVPGLAFDIRLADVQTLNEWALEGRLDVTKLSFAAWLTPEVSAPYALLEVGAALGRNCGPLVVAREPMELGTLRNKQVVTPGRLTTAHLLLRLFTGDAPIAAELPFERIMPAVAGALRCRRHHSRKPLCLSRLWVGLPGGFGRMVGTSDRAAPAAGVHCRPADSG